MCYRQDIIDVLSVGHSTIVRSERPLNRIERRYVLQNIEDVQNVGHNEITRRGYRGRSNPQTGFY